MSGPVKSGLIFGLIAIVAVIGVSFIPFVGPCVCGPGTVVIIGAVAGYFGVRWGAANSGVGSGVLAGSLAGVGALLGAVILFVIVMSMINTMPEVRRQLEEAFRQQPNTQLSPEDMTRLMNIAIPLSGFCLGLVYLLVSLAFGALGGWYATRNRPQVGQVPPFEPPTTASF